MNNCGSCGNRCDATRADSCSGGACHCGTGAACAAGQTCCGGVCADLAHDANHCLGCSNICDRNKADSCNSGCRCGSGAACGTGQTCCGGACVDTSTNTSNCGACGRSCGSGTNSCLTGTCSCGTHVGACSGGQTCCPNNGNTCYDLSSSASSFNCGTCGHSCLGDPCSGGTCQAALVTGTAAAPFNYPPENGNYGITAGGHTYTFNYGVAPNGDQDPAIQKDGTTICIWTTYGGANEEVSFWGLAADANYVYGLLQGGPLGVFKCPINGGTAISLFQDSSAYTNYGLVDSGTAIYWSVYPSSGGANQIYRLVK